MALLNVSSDGVAVPSTTGIAQSGRPFDRHVTAGITKPILLFERGIVLFIKNDHLQVGHRKKQRGSRTDNQPCKTASGHCPGLQTLPFTEAGMGYHRFKTQALPESG